ncbi:hypothetical protein G9A89_018232 [Geosiphon pyriformis]|nr:hypothetical protein G9A89_018232 [Geosiphon pyriformis]
MLVLRHNSLSSDHLITCERTMLKFIDGKLPNTGMNFKVWDWTIPELYGILLGMLVKQDIQGTLNITTSEMLDFIIEVNQGYLDTSYHSFYHAVDVVVVLYNMLTELGAGKFLTPLECVSLLIAGLCHDIGHPGLNNVYQVNAKTELAIRYNDQSVLENHSCTLTMDILTKHKLLRNVHNCNTEYFAMEPKEAEDSVRSVITKTILATDMIFHFELMENLNNMIESIWSPACSSNENSDCEMDQSCPNSPISSASSSLKSSSPLSSSSSQSSLFESNSSRSSTRTSVIFSLDSEQRQLWLNCLIHAADLSNAVRPWEISKHWSDMVVTEFFNQGDLEKKNNLPVSSNMDRNQAHQCQISLGFGDFFVKPFFEALATFLQPATIFLDILADNRVYWDALSKEPKAEPKISSDVKVLSDKENRSRGIILAAGLLIIPDDFQDTMRSPRSPRHRKLKRSLSGRSYSHHSLMASTDGILPKDDDREDLDDDDLYRKPTRRKSAGPNPTLSGQVTAMLLQPPETLTFTSTQKIPKTIPHIIPTTVSPPSPSLVPSTTTSTPQSPHKNLYQRRVGRVRRSSSLDQNMIRQFTVYFGNGGNNPTSTPPTEPRAVIAGS